MVFKVWSFSSNVAFWTRKFGMKLLRMSNVYQHIWYYNSFFVILLTVFHLIICFYRMIAGLQIRWPVKDQLIRVILKKVFQIWLIAILFRIILRTIQLRKYFPESNGRVWNIHLSIHKHIFQLRVLNNLTLNTVRVCWMKIRGISLWKTHESTLVNQLKT